MSRRWINSLDVEFDPAKGSILTDQTSPSSFGGGSWTGEAQTPSPLVEGPMPCRAVWLGAPMDDQGQATNAGPVFVGDQEGQNLPILADAFEGVVIRIDDASKLYLRAVNEGDGVEYRILR